VACEAAGVTPIVCKPLTSGAKDDGRFGKQDFIYQPETDTYRRPAGALSGFRLSTGPCAASSSDHAWKACSTLFQLLRVFSTSAVVPPLLSTASRNSPPVVASVAYPRLLRYRGNSLCPLFRHSR